MCQRDHGVAHEGQTAVLPFHCHRPCAAAVGSGQQNHPHSRLLERRDQRPHAFLELARPAVPIEPQVVGAKHDRDDVRLLLEHLVDDGGGTLGGPAGIAAADERQFPGRMGFVDEPHGVMAVAIASGDTVAEDGDRVAGPHPRRQFLSRGSGRELQAHKRSESADGGDASDQSLRHFHVVLLFTPKQPRPSWRA